MPPLCNWALGVCQRNLDHEHERERAGRLLRSPSSVLRSENFSPLTFHFSLLPASSLRPPWHAVVPRLPDESGCPSARSNLSSHLPLWSYYDYNMVMELVGVAQLKSKLSHYLAAVKRGKEITITSHRHSIARIVPLDNTGADLKIIPARKPVSSLRKLKAVKLKVDLVADLLADRRQR